MSPVAIASIALPTIRLFVAPKQSCRLRCCSSSATGYALFSRCRISTVSFVPVVSVDARQRELRADLRRIARGVPWSSTITR